MVLSLSNKTILSIFVIAGMIVVSGKDLRSEDIDMYRKVGPKNVMVVIDNHSSMTWPVYEQKIDYRSFMESLIKQGMAEDEEDCRNSRSWWDQDGSGNDYDKLDPNGIYLVSTWLSCETVQSIDTDNRMTQMFMISDVMENSGDEIDPAVNRRCSLLINPVIPVISGKNRLWKLDDKSSIDVDGNNHILFPSGIAKDIDGRSADVPAEIKEVTLPNGQDINLDEDMADTGTGVRKSIGFLQKLKTFGYYFSGVFETQDKETGFTFDSNESTEADFGGKQVYFFATGNWLNFIKLVEDFRVTSSYQDFSTKGYFPHQTDKAWRFIWCPLTEEGNCRLDMEKEGQDGLRIYSRMEVVQKVLRNLIWQTRDTIHWGITVLNGKNGGKVIAPLGTDTNELMDQVQGITVNDARPIGEAVQDAYNNNMMQFQTDHSDLVCGQNFFLIISGGFPTDDEEWSKIKDSKAKNFPSPGFGFCAEGYGKCDAYGDGDVWPDDNHCDDLAHWLKNESTYPHEVHAIGFGFDNPLMAEMASAGNGTYQTINGESDFSLCLTDIGQMITSTYTFSSPVVPVDYTNMTQSGDSLYTVFFQPNDEIPWAGNLKKYSLKQMVRGEGDCDRSQEELVITGSDGIPAVDCNGNLNATSISYWSDQADGFLVTAGGAGERLLKSIQRVDFKTDRFYDFRNIYTCKNPSVSKKLIKFYRDGDSTTEDTISPSDLGIQGGEKKENLLERDRIINFLYGYTYDALDSGGKTYDEVQDGAPLKIRNWILGDIIHSKPCVIDYPDENGKLEYRFIAVGANDGMLHVFADATDSSKPDERITIHGREYEPGDEIWAFIPGEFLPRLKDLRDNRSHQYFVDGFCSLYRSNTGNPPGGVSASKANGKYDDQVLVFGERRGGRCYWALDVSIPDPDQWFVRWRIEGGNGIENSLPELGYSWSKPTFATYREPSSKTREVVIFGGGYDPEEDHFPEAWHDGNYDGVYSPGDKRDIFDINNPQHDSLNNNKYDIFNPEQNEIGRGIFIMDLWDGSPVFQVSYGKNSATGTHQKNEDMKWCFPADPTVISYPGIFLLYAADIYGQIWKVSYNPLSGEKNWNVKRIFYTNPGSDQPDAMAALSVKPSLNSSDSGRKLFHSPDVSYMGTEWTDNPVLYFATGDREHPGYIAGYHNRFYVVSDMDIPANETDLINLTCDELDGNSDVNQDGSSEYEDESNNNDEVLQERLLDILYGVSDYPINHKTCRGWYRTLGKQGDCLPVSLDHNGEMGLDRPVLFFNTVYFSTFQPKIGDFCLPGGNSFFYAIDYSDGRAVFKKDKTGSTNILTDKGSIEDTYQMVENSGLPSEIKLITHPGGVAAFVSSGKNIFGLGSEKSSMIGHSSNIPSPPGGVQRMMWELY
jgi:type IV pilus assembly protein PilY1